MESTLQEFQSLTNELSRLEAVKHQIDKDFALSGLSLSENTPTWPKLIEELSSIISVIRSRNDGSWMKIVYRVDLTEKQYRFVKSLGGDSDENLAKAVILREFQKIITRERYRVES